MDSRVVVGRASRVRDCEVHGPVANRRRGAANVAVAHAFVAHRERGVRAAPQAAGAPHAVRGDLAAHCELEEQVGLMVPAKTPRATSVCITTIDRLPMNSSGALAAMAASLGASEAR